MAAVQTLRDRVWEPEDVGHFSCIVLMAVLASPARLLPALGGKEAFLFQAGHKKKVSGIPFLSRLGVRPSASLHLPLCPFLYIF